MAQRVEAHVGPAGCNTDTMLLEPYAGCFAEHFRRCREGIAPIPTRASDPKLRLALLACRSTD